MKASRFLAAVCAMAGLAVVMSAQRGGQAPASGAMAAQGPLTLTPDPGNGTLIGGTKLPAKPDDRGWGWQVKSLMDPKTPRPLWNVAKEKLLQGKTVTSYTVSSYNPEQYCEVIKHYDFIWFEMQHSTMSWDDIRRMMLTCPPAANPGTAAPMIRMPDALESNIQKATDTGAIGIIVPTVPDAIVARDAARFARYPPYGRRSSGAGSFGQIWNSPNISYRSQVNDNMLVVVMIETLEGVINANEIAATFGVDVVILGNNDLSSFSGWNQNDLRYQDAVIAVHDAALRNGKYFGNAGAQFLSGYTVSADTKFVQNGPANDGWGGLGGGRGRAGAGAAPAGAPAGGGRRGAGTPSTPPNPNEEPVIGLPGGAPGR